MNHRHSHHETDGHHHTSRLSDIILGGQDGLVNVLGVILGVAAATNDSSIVLVAGLAATFAESVSMGAVAYTSTLADSELYESERAREFRHIIANPEMEQEEIRQIYRRKGFDGDLLERIVEVITGNPDVWVAVMMSEELQLAPSDRRQAFSSALIVGAAAIVGSLIPLAPYIWLPVDTSMWVSVVIAATTLFTVGAYKARVTIGHPGRSGLEMALIGTLSALAGYLAGVIFKAPVTP